MKVTILKKIINEGFSERTQKNYKIKSLFVKFDDPILYKRIISQMISNGATQDMAEKTVKASVYKEELNYTFSLNCSTFTFDRVEKFGVLDAQIEFKVNDSGYINPSIVKSKNDKGITIDQVLGYEKPQPFEPSEEVVAGWAVDAPEPIPEVKRVEEELQEKARLLYESDPFEQSKPANAPAPEKSIEELIKTEDEVDDLPF